MAEDTPTKKSGVWTEAEKYQLVLSMLDSAGKVDWSRVVVPGNRSVETARFQYSQIKKKAGIVANDQPTSNGGTPTPKRKRTAKPKDVDASNEDDEEGQPPIEKKKRVYKPRPKVKKGTAETPVADAPASQGSMPGMDGELVGANGHRDEAAVMQPVGE